jgi:hypothetical protein
MWSSRSCHLTIGRWLPTLWRNIPPPPSGLKFQKMKTAGSSETLVTSYQTIRCRNPEDQNLNLHRRVQPSIHFIQKREKYFSITICWGLVFFTIKNVITATKMASVIWRQHVTHRYSDSLWSYNWREVWPMIVTRWNVSNQW